MNQTKVITVFGEPDAQGAGLIRAILNGLSGGFAARAVARDTKSDEEKEPARPGAGVVAADIDREARMRRALDGTYWRMRCVGRLG